MAPRISCLALVVLLPLAAQALPKEVATLELQPLATSAPPKAKLNGKITLVVIWTSWCEVCERALPGYMQIAQQLKDKGVVFVAISGDDEKAEALEAVKTRKYGFPSYWADKDKVKATLKITGVPTVLVYDGDINVLRFAGEGPELEEKLKTTLAQLTSKK